MKHVFISHSSAQKQFVDEVVNQIGIDNAIVDMYDFESAAELTPTIKEAIDTANLFVIFFSKEAIMSMWVDDELQYCRRRVKNKEMVFCPFIVDESVKWDDENIPSWVSNYISDTIINPFIVSNVIKRHIRLLSFKEYKYLEEREKLFVGRDNEIGDLRDKLYVNGSQQIRSIVVSGIEHIGRKKFVKRFIENELLGGLRHNYEPAVINLNEYDGLDEFAYQLNHYTRGIPQSELPNIVSQGEDVTIEFCVGLLNKWLKMKQRFIVVDYLSIVKNNGFLSDWFINLLNNPHLKSAIHLSVISRYSPRLSFIQKYNNLVSIQLSALDRSNMLTLMNMYSELLELHITSEDKEFFLSRLAGYPKQVYNIVDIIKESGLHIAKQEINEVARIYDKDFVKSLNLLSDKDLGLEILALLASFEYISFDWLNQICKESKLPEILAEFDKFAFLETFGTSHEFIRLSPIVQDYIRRQARQIPLKYKHNLRKFVEDAMKDLDSKDLDLSQFLHTIKTLIKEDPKNVQSRYLMPSLVLKVIVDEYNAHNNNNVVILAEKILNNKNTNFRDSERDVYYWYCLALCRLQDEKFFEAVKFFPDGSYASLFLRGFYCRIQNNLSGAKKFYEQALKGKFNLSANYYSKVEHELVIVYMMEGNYQDALPMAERNYHSEPSNPYHIEAYFRCLVKSNNPDLSVLSALMDDMSFSLDRLHRIKNETMKAEYLFYIDKNFEGAYKILMAIFSTNKDKVSLRYPISVLREMYRQWDHKESVKKILYNFGIVE